ncbi:hypothetical protein QUF84_18075 [Fictibacillus enclensis]|uniref:hypothetical protein n=1 Tax=Fictibacillus enclensis TaxID=1017270 RepID=UPI0025A0F87D|nr:hypothetical protein [Fictibacillus enclensis]MDM5339112.1 hypothetical protein [Fictibacillus enclensis]
MMSLQRGLEKEIESMSPEEARRIVTEAFLVLDQVKEPADAGISKEEAFDQIKKILNSNIKVK